MRRTPAAVAPIAAPAVAPVVSWRTESVCKTGDMMVSEKPRGIAWCFVEVNCKLSWTIMDSLRWLKVKHEVLDVGRCCRQDLTNRENGISLVMIVATSTSEVN
jgi:hypothetical protein